MDICTKMNVALKYDCCRAFSWLSNDTQLSIQTWCKLSLCLRSAIRFYNDRKCHLMDEKKHYCSQSVAKGLSKAIVALMNHILVRYIQNHFITIIQGAYLQELIKIINSHNYCNDMVIRNKLMYSCAEIRSYPAYDHSLCLEHLTLLLIYIPIIA